MPQVLTSIVEAFVGVAIISPERLVLHEDLRVLSGKVHCDFVPPLLIEIRSILIVFRQEDLDAVELVIIFTLDYQLILSTSSDTLKFFLGDL